MCFIGGQGCYIFSINVNKIIIYSLSYFDHVTSVDMYVDQMSISASQPAKKNKQGLWGDIFMLNGFLSSLMF